MACIFDDGNVLSVGLANQKVEKRLTLTCRAIHSHLHARYRDDDSYSQASPSVLCAYHKYGLVGLEERPVAAVATSILDYLFYRVEDIRYRVWGTSDLT